MEKVKVLKVLNLFLFASFLVQAVTGVSLFLKLHGPLSGLFWEVHEYNGLLLIGLIGAHLFLNWPFVRGHYFAKTKK